MSRKGNISIGRIDELSHCSPVDLQTFENTLRRPDRVSRRRYQIKTILGDVELFQYMEQLLNERFKVVQKDFTEKQMQVLRDPFLLDRVMLELRIIAEDSARACLAAAPLAHPAV